MTDLHPHWHSTADDETGKRVPNPPKTKNPVRVSVRSASRMPGATAGIVVFALIGFTVAGGWQALNVTDMTGMWHALTAQVGTPESSAPVQVAATDLPAVEIHITGTSGFQPEKVTVKPGQKITWINDQSIPHILTSQTLRNGSGVYLNTPAIFPGARESFTVGPNEPSREHSIGSTTDQTLHGTIVVSSSGDSAGSSSRKPAFGGTDGINLPSGQGMTLTPASSSSRSSSVRVTRSSSSAATVVVSPVEQIPGNGAAPVFPPETFSGVPPTLDAFGAGSPPVNPFDAQLHAAENNFPPAAPQPREQPHTGPGLWIVCAVTIAAMWWMTRKYFVRVV